MAFHLFQFPLPGAADLGELNRCLAAHRVVAVNQHVVPAVGGGATLVFVVQTVDGAVKAAANQTSKIDYKQELSAEDFAVFNRLREERKKLAEAEGVPAYAVLTNEQLAELARQRPRTLAELAALPGLGCARLEKHGAQLLALLHPAAPAAEPSHLPASSSL